MLKSTKAINVLFGVVCLLVGGLLAYLDYLSPGYSGGGDTYNHYLIARFSWQNPELFLDYWGKPVYTVIASLFARLGLAGSVLLNILCLIGSAIAVFITAQRLNFKNYFLAGVIVLLCPVFLDNTISSLTEPLFAFFLALIMMFISQNRIGAAAVVAGFLPHLRSEGLIILGVLLVYFVLKNRSIKPLLLMAVGSLGINMLGWWQTGEPFWIITSNPYIGAQLSGASICGSGSLFHYPWQTHYTFGLVNSFLAALSAILIVWHVYKKKIGLYSPIVLTLVLFVTFYGAHVFIWWQGLMGSCGYIRVMTIVAPLIALLVVYAIEHIVERLARLKGEQSYWLQVGVIVFVFLVQIITPIRYFKHRYPIPLSEEEEVFQEVAEWYKSQEVSGNATVYLNPYFSVVGDVNPYDNTQHFQLYASGIQWIKSGDYVIWDAHFCPNEGGVPKSTFVGNAEYEHLKTFKPKERYITLNDYEYEVLVFRKR